METTCRFPERTIRGETPGPTTREIDRAYREMREPDRYAKAL
jgi:hypothetical protein